MQILLTSLLAFMAVLPLWWYRSGRGGLWPRLSLTLLAVLVAFSAFAAPPHEPIDATSRPIEVLDDGYVGSATCRSCHPEHHANWWESFHRTMTQIASRDTLVPEFERLDLDWFGEPVRLEWRGERLWATFARGGASPAAVDRPVEQITGSHHMQVLWYSTGKGRELAPVPLCYKIEEGLWLPLTAAFVLPPEYRDPPEPGAWSQSCHRCHATNARPRIDVGRNDTQVSEFGIACEACHGPGEKHVAANRNPLRRFENRRQGRDGTIVNPGSLTPTRSAQVCGQCHSVSIVKLEHFDGWREHGQPYRPGQDLAATNLVVGTGDRHAPELRRELQKNPGFFASAFWSDGQVRLSGREFNGLQQSPCYQHGDTAHQIDCSSCHQMHRDAAADAQEWRSGQMHPDKRGNAMCTQCHGDLGEPASLSAHTRHDPDSVGSACANCHMPHTSFGLMKASRSHAITSPSVSSELATGRPNACNLCHLDRSLQWTNEHLQAGFGIEPAALDVDQRDVAAAVRWLLTGDAGQRALAVWSFGWRPAQQASGTDWSAPFLARLLDDPYYAVRFGAARSLRSLPADAFDASALVGYDFLAEPAAARLFGDAVTARWSAGFVGAARPAVLLTGQGLVAAEFQRLYARRDDRPVFLAE